MKTKILAILALAGSIVSCSDYLERPPYDKVENSPEFYNSENNVRSTVNGWYDIYFTGYETGWTRSDFFDGTDRANWCDDLAQESATYFTTVAPSTSTNWSFANVRRINLLFEGVTASTLPEEVKNHWLGIARFFRGMEYARLVRMFGDVPYYDHVVLNTDVKDLYKPRDSREYVMDKVAEDFEFASKFVRQSDGTKGLTVNRDVVNAFISRVMLFEGTWQKYVEKNDEYAAKYLQIAKTAAETVMSSGYTISDNYKALTNSISLAGNPEIILYREYEEGVITHAEMSWQSEQTLGNAPSKDLIDSYLTTNGLPIAQAGNDQYKGDKTFKDEMTNRDPRLSYNIVDSLCLNGVTGAVYGISGYMGNRFVNTDLMNTPGGQSSTNITDAPIMKLNEVMLNYLEAAAELAQLGKYTLTQTDLDNTINAIRDRADVKMPHVTLKGDQFEVEGVVVDDPNRDKGYAEVPGDYAVPSIIWEIRRERRIELVYEGIRFDDIRRWGKLHYADMVLNKKLNLGSWLDKEAYIEEFNKTAPAGKELTLEKLEAIYLDRAGNAGYIKPIPSDLNVRTYADKDYLYPIPTGQISLYKSKSEQTGDPSLKLEQNPGW